MSYNLTLYTRRTTHKRRLSYLYNFEEDLEKADFKNGVDIFLDDEHTLVFIV